MRTHVAATLLLLPLLFGPLGGCLGVYAEAGALWNARAVPGSSPDKTHAATGMTYTVGLGMDLDFSRKARFGSGVTYARMAEAGAPAETSAAIADLRVDFNLLRLGEDDDQMVRGAVGFGSGERGSQVFAGLALAQYFGVHHSLTLAVLGHAIAAEVGEGTTAHDLGGFGPGARLTYVFSLGNNHPRGVSARALDERRKERARSDELDAREVELAPKCRRGDQAACAALCAQQGTMLRSAKARALMPKDFSLTDACRSLCEGGNHRACVDYGNKLMVGLHSTDPVAARAAFLRGCDHGVLGGCFAAVRYFPDQATPEQRSSVLDRLCASGNPLGCFMNAMNALAANRPIDEVLPTVDRSCRTLGSGQRDVFGSCDLLGCLTGTSVQGAVRSQDQRQSDCIRAEVTANTNFPWGRAYRAAVGEIAALPWTRQGAVNLDVLPTGRGWSCCGWTPELGYVGGGVQLCERSPDRCTERANQVPRSGRFTFLQPKEHHSLIAWCFTRGASYRCAGDIQTCQGLASKAGGASPCVPVGDPGR